MGWLGRYLVKRATWVVLTAVVAALLVFVGAVEAAPRTGAGPAVAAPGVPCDGPDDPPGCDPEETPTPTPTPEPTPTPTPEPTPTPTPAPVVVILSDEDRDRLDLSQETMTAGVGLIVFLLTIVAVVTGLRR